MNETAPVTSEEIEPGIVLLTLNQLETRNAISGNAMIEALLAALETANADPAVRVIVLTGAGTAFSSGGNLKKMSGDQGIASTSPVATRHAYRTGIQQLPLAFERLDVPVIAAVNGPAIGAGCDLTCMCDLRVAARSAVFAESFVTLGLIPGDGGAWLLPRVVGFAKASEMALTGARIDAQEALACGLVSKVVDDDALIETALGLARQIAANAPVAVRMTRRLLREAQHARLESVLELSAALQAVAHTTGDHKEAIKGFIEKRPAKFQGH